MLCHTQHVHFLFLVYRNSKWLLERDGDRAKKAELTENRIAFEILSAPQGAHNLGVGREQIKERKE